MQYGAAHIAAQKLEDCRYEIMSEGVLVKCEGIVRKPKVQLQDEESDRVCAKVVGLHHTQITQSGITNQLPVIVPTCKQSLSVFEWSYWTKCDPSRYFISKLLVSSSVKSIKRKIR